MEKKIPEDVREAYERAIKEVWTSSLDFKWATCHERAEEILNRPKYSPLQKKIVKRVCGTDKVNEYVLDGEWCMETILKALEGIVELPEEVTAKMASGFLDIYRSHTTRGTLINFFKQIRQGKYSS